jgi:hypothetical protein
MRNQVKAAAWVSESRYISFVAFKHWMQADFEQPDWKLPGTYIACMLLTPGR